MTTFTALLFHLQAIQFSLTQWISPSTPTLPISNRYQAVGSFQNTIYIVGGADNQNGLIGYNLDNNTFSNNATFFTKSMLGSAQWSYQMDNILYMSSTSRQIDTFNLQTRQFTNTAFNINSSAIGASSCITGDPTQSLLYFIGGEKSSLDFDNTLQILNINTVTWTLGPKMTTTRAYFPCIVSPNKHLYAMGGKNINMLDSIELIPTTNITANTWRRLENNLSEPLMDMGSVMVNDNIFVIGGWGNNGVTDKVHIINTITNDVYLANERLAYNICCMATILISHNIYVFGGLGSDSNYPSTDKWQYIDLATEPPSLYPSQSPTFHGLCTSSILQISCLKCN